MKSLLFSLLICLFIIIRETNCDDDIDDSIFIQTKVRFGNYFLQYGRFFESFLMILDLYQQDTVLFSNMNKEIAKDTQLDTKTNNETFINNIEINGIIVKDFNFKVKRDKDESVDENDINGILGLGINEDGSNAFTDQLKERGFINKRIVFITQNIFLKLDFLFDLKKREIAQYHYCNSMYAPYYKWNCPLSHIIIGDTNSELISLPYNTISIFSPRNMFTEVPFDFLSLFKERLLLKQCGEKKIDDGIVVVCKWSNDELVDHLKKEVIVVISGIGITIKGEALYQNYDSDRKMLMMLFKKTPEPIWNFGFSFVAENSLSLDYDNMRLGFRNTKGEDKEYKTYNDLFDDWLENKGIPSRVRKGPYILFAVIEIMIILIFIITIFVIVRRYQYKSYQARSNLFNNSKRDNTANAIIV